MVLEAHDKTIYLSEIFQNVCLKSLDTLDYLHSHPCVVKANETIVSPLAAGQENPRGASFQYWVKYSHPYLKAVVQLVIAKPQLTK